MPGRASDDRARWAGCRRAGTPGGRTNRPGRAGGRNGRTGGKRVRYVIRERFFRLGEDSDITDESGRPVLHVDGKVLTLRDRLVVRDPAGQEVATVHRKLIALRPTYEITVAGREVAEVRKHFF